MSNPSLKGDLRSVISSGRESLETLTFSVRIVEKFIFWDTIFLVVLTTMGEAQISLHYLHSYQNGYNRYALTRARIVFILVLTSRI